MDPKKILVVDAEKRIDQEDLAALTAQHVVSEAEKENAAAIKLEAMRRVISRLPKRIKRAMTGKETVAQMMTRLGASQP